MLQRSPPIFLNFNTMNYTFFILSVFTFSILISCQSKSQEKTDLKDEQTQEIVFQKIGTKIIGLSDLQEGEKVLLVMQPGEFNPIIPILQEAVKKEGAIYLGAISVTEEQPESWTTEFTDKSAGMSIDDLETILEEVDLGIMLPGANPSHATYKALQNILEEGIRRTIHFHWAGAYDLSGNLLQTDETKSAFYQDVIMNTDYLALASIQEAFEEAMRGESIEVTTPEGTNLSFTIGDRPVTKQDGNASAARAQLGRNLIDREIEIPSGAIRVAPLEESVNGTIAFPDAQWNGQSVTGLLVTIENGKITEVDAETGRDAVLEEMERAGDAGRSFREFALGFNPLMPVQVEPEAWIPYYGYGAGVVRLSLGDNTELGGNVGGGYVRWNFFTNATVTVGDEVWVEDGVLRK